VRCISGVGIVRQAFSFEWKRPVRQRVEIRNPGIRIGQEKGLGELAGSARGEQIEIVGIQGCSTAANRDAGIPAGKVGATGAKFKVGWGRVRYRTFSFLSKLMKYSVLNGGTAWNCAAFEQFQSGEPLALIMKQVLDGISPARHIGREDVIEGTVLADQNDDVLNRGCGLLIIGSMPVLWLEAGVAIDMSAIRTDPKVARCSQFFRTIGSYFLSSMSSGPNGFVGQ